MLGAQIKATRLSDRYVTVKGLVERKVKSDLACGRLLIRKREITDSGVCEGGVR